MAVPARQTLREIPEFRPSRIARSRFEVDPLIRPHRPIARRSPRRTSRQRRTLGARMLQSRTMNDACAVGVGAVGLLFAVSVARMLLGG